MKSVLLAFLLVIAAIPLKAAPAPASAPGTTAAPAAPNPQAAPKPTTAPPSTPSTPSTTPSGPLPRVLVIGDTVYRDITPGAAKELKGRVDVVYANIKFEEILHTGISPARLDEILGKTKWDLIHFNFGLGDLMYKAPGIASIRPMSKEVGGVRVTPQAQYEKNLQSIVTRLKASGAKLVWASTTPIRASSSNIFEPGSEVEYNTIAARIMAKEQIPINDMHAYALTQMNMKRPAGHGADPFNFDNKPMHPPLVTAIQQQLGVK